MEERPVPSPNAYDFYLAACEAMIDEDLPKSCSGGCACQVEQRELTLEEKSAIMERNSAALQTLREGFRYEFIVPRAVRSQRWDPAGFHMGVYRLTVLLWMEQEVCRARRDHAGEMSSLVDAIRLSSDIPRGGLLGDAIGGRAAEEVTLWHSWGLVDRLDAESARNFARRMEEICRNCWPLFQSLKEEWRLGRTELLEYLGEPMWRHKVAHVYTAEEGWLAFMSAQIRLRRWGKEDLLAGYEQYMEAQVARSQMPYFEVAQRPEVMGEAVRHYMPLREQTSARELYDKVRAQEALLTTALALHACRLDRGAYPTSLDELVPDYLCEVHDDPYARSAPLRYRIDGDRYILYSVGPDGKDDGGRPVYDTRPILDERYGYSVQVDSDGDFVAGMNH